MRVICPMRKPDRHGAGHFGAPRGSRTHNGVDFACAPGSTVLACECGDVTKLGYPYADDLSYRYVEITDAMGLRWRYFYVQPSVKEGQQIMQGDAIGESQALGPRYEGITEHVHLEIKDANGEFINPTIMGKG